MVSRRTTLRSGDLLLGGTGTGCLGIGGSDSGRIRWRKGVSGGRVYANADDLLAIDAETGAVGSVAVDSDLVYASSNERLFGVTRG